MSTHQYFVRLVYLMMLTLALSVLPVSSSPASDEDRDIHRPDTEKRYICEPCGVYCCGELEFCHQDILFDGWSDPYCRPFGIATGTRTRTRTRDHDRDHDRTATHSDIYDNQPTLRTITSAFATQDSNHGDHFSRTTTVQITVTSKIAEDPLPTDTSTGGPGAAAPSTTGTETTPPSTTTGTGGAGNSGFAAGTATTTPSSGVNNNRELRRNEAQLVVMGIVLFCFLGA